MSKIAKLEWLVIIYDVPMSKRLTYRAQHLSKVPSAVASGAITSCGPIFKDEAKTEFLGSSFTIEAASRSAVLELLKSDIYAEQGVWDFDNVVIHPYAPFVRVAKDIPS